MLYALRPTSRAALRLAGLLALILFFAASAAAQISRVGVSQALVNTSTQENDICYDPGHSVYLLVGGAGKLFGVFADTTGSLISGVSSFPLGSTNSSSFFGFTPRCLFSQDLNNGAGGFLVVWHQTEGNGGAPTNTHSLVAVYPTGAVAGSEKVLTDNSDGGTQWIIGPAMAYSKSSHQFLVVWTSYHYQIQGRLVDSSGNPIGSGSPILVAKGSGDTGVRDAGITWNPATNEFGLANTGWQGSSGFFAQFRRFKDTDASVSGSVSTFAVGGVGNYMGTAEVNLWTNHYVVGWTAAGAYRAEFDQNGTMVSGPALFAGNFGSYDSLAIAFNNQSGTFLAVGHDPSGEDAAIELAPTGAPISPPGKIIATNGSNPNGGSFYPRAIARTDAKQWGMSYARNFVSITSQIIATASSGGPPPPPPGGVQLFVDTPTASSTLSPPFAVAGWAVDTRAANDNGIDTVHVWAVPTNQNLPAVFVGLAPPSGDRDDVASAFGQHHRHSGFGVVMSNVPPGQYTLVFYPHSSVTGDFDYNKVATRSITITGSVLTQIDTPTWGQSFVNSGINMQVNGYAINLSSPAGTGIDAVHVWAIDPFNVQAPVFLGAATLGSHHDVAALFGAQFASGGYSLTNQTSITPGVRYILVYSKNTGAQTFNVAQMKGVFIFQ